MDCHLWFIYQICSSQSMLYIDNYECTWDRLRCIIQMLRKKEMFKEEIFIHFYHKPSCVRYNNDNNYEFLFIWQVLNSLRRVQRRTSMLNRHLRGWLISYVIRCQRRLIQIRLLDLPQLSHQQILDSNKLAQHVHAKMVCWGGSLGGEGREGVREGCLVGMGVK